MSTRKPKTKIHQTDQTLLLDLLSKRLVSAQCNVSEYNNEIVVTYEDESGNIESWVTFKFHADGGLEHVDGDQERQ